MGRPQHDHGHGHRLGPAHASASAAVVAHLHRLVVYPNGFRYQLQRIIPADVHQMPEGGSGWFQYRRTATNLRSVANGGKVAEWHFPRSPL